jgi:hypothetical protein
MPLKYFADDIRLLQIPAGGTTSSRYFFRDLLERSPPSRNRNNGGFITAFQHTHPSC